MPKCIGWQGRFHAGLLESSCRYRAACGMAHGRARRMALARPRIVGLEERSAQTTFFAGTIEFSSNQGCVRSGGPGRSGNATFD
ncbi:protein of unknown function (plasmid) [Cupriavidus taiwanensis]|uniref:Uncharacterized protein n=1 Tax=Cupriavidus taiwanensis TaxID=164546 RepID=A0A375IQC3_9BURK|nr:protein of unknown function [Cupriavidus taiwanensis]